MTWRQHLIVTDPLEPPQSQLPLLLEADVVPGHHDRLRDELPELCPHLLVVMVQQLGHLLHGEAGGKQLRPDLGRGHRVAELGGRDGGQAPDLRPHTRCEAHWGH